MCPEAINKKYSIKHKNKNNTHWQVDGKSDVYQVSKLIWCILLGSIPNGIIKSDDLVGLKDSEYLFGNYFKKSLLCNKDKRPSMDGALSLFIESSKANLI
jgi:hypothetical protein